MRKKIAACIGVIALIVAAMLAFYWTTPPAVPLRVGMTGEEVDHALGQPNHSKERSPTSDGLLYGLKPDWLAEGENVAVLFDDKGDKGRVIRWEKCPSGHYHRRSWWESFKFVTGLK